MMLLLHVSRGCMKSVEGAGLRVVLLCWHFSNYYSASTIQAVKEEHLHGGTAVASLPVQLILEEEVLAVPVHVLLCWCSAVAAVCGFCCCCLASVPGLFCCYAAIVSNCMQLLRWQCANTEASLIARCA